MIKLLLERGADINAKNHDGHTALDISDWFDDHNASKLLLQKVDANFRTRMSARTVLHLAAQCGDKAMVELFIDKGIEINALDE